MGAWAAVEKVKEAELEVEVEVETEVEDVRGPGTATALSSGAMPGICRGIAGKGRRNATEIETV